MIIMSVAMGNFICFSFDSMVVCMHVTSVDTIEQV